MDPCLRRDDNLAYVWMTTHRRTRPLQTGALCNVGELILLTPCTPCSQWRFFSPLGDDGDGSDNSDAVMKAMLNPTLCTL